MNSNILSINLQPKLIVIGGGPAGLAAAMEAYRSGIAAADILIVERDTELGGILNQCIHAGFGLHLFGEELTGPEYAERFINEVKEAGIQYITDSMVLSLNADKSISLVSPSLGFRRIHAEAVIIACGCRERSRGALNIPGSRPSGIFTAGSAQRFVNIEDCNVGKKVVILGSGDIGLIMARRMTLEGASVECVCELLPYSNGLARNIAQCLNDFKIPLLLSHTITQIRGTDRIEGVTISKVDEKTLLPIAGTERYIECDTLLLSVGLIPENELAREAGINIDRLTGGTIVNQRCETSVPGIFACGNALHVHDLVDFVTLEAYNAGRSAASYISGKLRKPDARVCVTECGAGVKYIVPQKIETSDTDEPEEIKLFFRADKIYRNIKIAAYGIDDDNEGGELIKKVSKMVVMPGEMEYATVKSPIKYKKIRIDIESRGKTQK
jgi:thioredoxin reductase